MTRKPRLTEAEKRQKRFDDLMENARCYSPYRYIVKYASKDFQRMIRAEAGASTESVPYVDKEGNLLRRSTSLGCVICVTCGRVGPWQGSYFGGMFHTGHFVASRVPAIVFEPTNVAPQCAFCNKQEYGATDRYKIWMIHVHGQDEIDRLNRLKNDGRDFTLEELVDLRIEYKDRIAAAIKVMK